jgi:hypothetical protein
MPHTRPQLTHDHKSVTLASRSNGEGLSAFVLKGHSRTLTHGTVYVIGAVDAPTYLSPAVAERARGLASRLIDQETGEDTYWRGTELMSLFGLHLRDDVPGRLYVVWGDLTDIWELHLERRAESVELMREAAREFLALNNTTSDLDAYLTRWYERLGQS